MINIQTNKQTNKKKKETKYDSFTSHAGPLGDLVVIGKHASKRMQDWAGTDTGGEIVFGDEGPFGDDGDDECDKTTSASPMAASKSNSPSRSPQVG